MDSEYARMSHGFEHALFVQATVISRSAGRIVVDAGSKSIGDGMLATIVGTGRGTDPHRRGARHLQRRKSGPTRSVGDRVRLVPGYAPATVNLYDAYHVVADDVVVDVWPITPRGPGHGGFEPQVVDPGGGS